MSWRRPYPGHEGHPRARQGEIDRGVARRRPRDRRRARGRPCRHVPPIRARAARRGQRRPDPQASPRRRRPHLRSGPLSGDARHAARGDAGERGHRHRVRDRGSRRCRARTGRRQPAFRAASLGSPHRFRGHCARADACRRSSPTAGARPPHAAVPAERHASGTQIVRLADRLPLPHIELPFVFSPDITRPQLDVLADALTRGIEQL